MRDNEESVRQERPEEPASAETKARAHYVIGGVNRRIAAATENLLRDGMAKDDDRARFLCTCGRKDCEEVFLISLAAYERVRTQPHRFVVAPGHATRADQVIAKEDDYWVVEVAPEFRWLAAKSVAETPIPAEKRLTVVVAAPDYLSAVDLADRVQGRWEVRTEAINGAADVVIACRQTNVRDVLSEICGWGRHFSQESVSLRVDGKAFTLRLQPPPLSWIEVGDETPAELSPPEPE